MTSSVLGIDTTQVKETDPRTGREKVFYLPKINQQTGKVELVKLPKSSRRQGTYIIGSTGSGKTALLKNLIRQDIKQQTGVVVIDPHGDLITDIIAGLSDDEVQRVILLDIEDTDFQGTDYYPGLNIYQCNDPTDDDLVTETHGRIEHIFDVVTLENSEEKLGVRVLQGIRNSAYTFIDSSPVYGCTMLELPMLFREDGVRAKLVSHLTATDTTVRDYWKKFEGFDRFERASREDMVVNKIEGYIINRKLRRIIGQSRNTLNFREIIDCKPGKIVLVRLPGDNEGMTELLGKMKIAQLLAAAFSRKTIPLQQRKQCNIYCDEFELYASDDFTRLLKECRKYGMAVTIAHQSRDFIDLRNKAASLQVANLIVLRIIRKDADEVAGNFDCTPIRTKKVPKRRTKPVFREWDETVWIENGELLYKEALARYEAEYEERLLRLTPLLRQAQQEERKQAALLRIEREAQSVFRASAFGGVWDYPVWCFLLNYHPDRIVSRSLYTKPRLRPSPFQYEWEKERCGVLGEGWTDQMVERTIGKLVEVNEQVLTGSFQFHYTGRSFIFFGDNMTKWTRVTYDYLERQERYTLAEATPINVQVSFSENIRNASKEAREILREPQAELAQIIPAVRSQGIWFHPALAPSPIEDLSGRSKQLHIPPPDHVSRALGNGIITKEVVSMMTNRQVLDHYPQPQIGQKRTVLGWTQHGFWHMQEHPQLTAWREKWKQILHALIEQREEKLSSCKERVKRLEQQLGALQSQDREVRPKIKAHFQTTEHHKMYLGEQPDTDPQTRVSHSYSRGSSETTGLSWPGTSHSYGRSASHSTSYSTTDVQWYDLVDEPDQTHAQRQDEIASEIANFPDYIARVKIKDENEELVEYTIRTLAPEPGLRGRALEERILQIKAAMIRQNIVRPKHVIDEEITKRQQVLRLPPRKSSETQKSLPPPEDEPPITRRR